MLSTIWVAALTALALAQTPSSPDGRSLHGLVVAGETGDIVPDVRVVLDSTRVAITLPDGTFHFGPIEPGTYTLAFEHIAYKRKVVTIAWPQQEVPVVVALDPTEFVVPPIEVTAEYTIPALPVSSVAFDREVAAITPGNIANDPLRTVQAHPAAATAGVDFLSTMALRGGNTEEHRVYLDNFPMRHYAHVGGFSSLMYDEMLERTILVPGAAPIRYKGALSGVIVFAPATPDTTIASLRYDITSIAGGGTYVASPKFKIQASAKSDFFNLPVYQQVGVDVRHFKDVYARAIIAPSPSWTIRPTVMWAEDEEVGTPVGGTSQRRETASTLAGIDFAYQPNDWQFAVRPYYSYYQSLDEVSWLGSAREHELNEAHVFASLQREGTTVGFGLMGQYGYIEHSGNGGPMRDTPYSASAELRLLYRDAAALVLGAGGSREEWTSTFEPEAYASLRLTPWQRLSLSGAVRRSHQTPFLFNERRFFASIQVDPGDLASNYDPEWEASDAVRMDQASVEARLELPFKTYIEGNGFVREYDRLLLWDWDQDFPTPRDVVNGGTGRGHGYEAIVGRHDPDFLTVMVAFSSARVWKTEGTLTTERLGDFDKPDALQIGISWRMSKTARVSLRWTDVAGRPFTRYRMQDFPPPDEQVNDERLERFRRLDIKLTFDIPQETYRAQFFIDIVNFTNRQNIAATYALQTSPGVFQTVPYGGTRFFPIGGLTIWF